MWLDTLTEDQRQSVYAEMRKIGERIASHYESHRALSAPQGQIEVGAAHMDEWFPGYALECFLSALRGGRTPSHAAEHAREAIRDAVEKHNAKRPRDVNWQRWSGTADLVIAGAREAIRRAAAETTATA